jgi:hypothetical protein
MVPGRLVQFLKRSGPADPALRAQTKQKIFSAEEANIYRRLKERFHLFLRMVTLHLPKSRRLAVCLDSGLVHA